MSGICVKDIATAADYEAELKMLAPYIRYLCDVMRLRDFDFDIYLEQGDGDYYARIEPAPYYRRSAVYLTAAFFHSPPEKQLHSLLHELDHRICKPLQNALDLCCEELAPSAYRLAKKSHDGAVESNVDHHADILCKLLPTFEQWRAGYRPGLVKEV